MLRNSIKNYYKMSGFLYFDHFVSVNEWKCLLPSFFSGSLISVSFEIYPSGSSYVCLSGDNLENAVFTKNGNQ